jgi:signal transduction histidine kinase/PAS domain-containing protein
MPRSEGGSADVKLSKSAAPELDKDGDREMSLAEQLELRNAELERLNRDLGYQINQLETTLSLVPVGIAICEEPSSKTFRLNREGGVLLGVPENSTIDAAGEVRGGDSRFSVRFIEDPDTPAELPIRRVLESGEEVLDQALRVIRSDGSQIDILASAVPLLDQNNRIRGAIAAFVDNTGQEKERRRLTARHAAERAVSHLGIELLSEYDTNIVIEMALDALVRDLEVEIAAVFEFRPSEGDLILRAGTGWRDVNADQATLSPAFDVHGPSPFVISDLREGENFSPPAWLVEQEVVSGVGTAIRRPGEPYGALGVFSRSVRRFSEVEINFLVTVAALLGAALERDQMERMLVETRDRLTLADARQAAERAEQLASLGTLAAGISHEINNPLNSILVNAELGLMKLESGQDSEKVRPVLETIVEDVRRCARITQSVLNLAKNSGAPKATANLNDVVLRARDLVASHLQLHDASVDLELGDLPDQHLDANAMESAMVNLMRNAAESRELGVTVSVRTRLDGDTVIVEVSDDGPGIAPEHLDHVFDPFYSTKRSRKGTGLGLSLVHSTVIDHGGVIRVTSSEDVGTTFEIRLPLPDEPEDSGEEVTPG